jgi:sugar phosphate isomerase/epimerase
MRLGAPIWEKFASPEAWVEAVRRAGFRTAYCPLTFEADASDVKAYREAADRADIRIAEVGAWSNPISSDEKERRAAIVNCQRHLDLAERIGAGCCVNIAGSRGKKWDGPDEKNLSKETFDLIVETVREIIDAVCPNRAAYALETMPWIFPRSIDDYARLVRAIDRKGFAVHLDFVNLIASPDLYYHHVGMMEDALQRLGPFIRSFHAKDIILREHLTVHLDEVRPGLGGLNYRAFFRIMKKLPSDTPVLLEHLNTAEEYKLAAVHLREVAALEGVEL